MQTYHVVLHQMPRSMGNVEYSVHGGTPDPAIGKVLGKW